MSEKIFDQKYELCNPPCIEETIAGDAVVINLDSGKYYNLAGDAGKVWSLLLKGISINELVTTLASKYPQDIQTNDQLLELKNKLADLINLLLSESMLRPKSLVNASKVILPEVSFKMNIENPSLEVYIYNDMQELLALDPIHESDESIGWPKAAEDKNTNESQLVKEL